MGTIGHALGVAGSMIWEILWALIVDETDPRIRAVRAGDRTERQLVVTNVGGLAESMILAGMYPTVILAAVDAETAARGSGNWIGLVIQLCASPVSRWARWRLLGVAATRTGQPGGLRPGEECERGLPRRWKVRCPVNDYLTALGLAGTSGTSAGRTMDGATWAPSRP
jgi:hypothetical protein